MTQAKFLWIQKQDMGPKARGGHAAAFDESRGRVIAFGGEAGGQYLDDTWSWDGALWTQVADTGPSARSLASMVFTDNAGGILLFGGRRDGTRHGDSWQWSENGWVQVENSGPTARAGHALAYDIARKRVVLFGGNTGTAPAGDTWEWDGVQWVQLEDTGPTPRSGHSMAFDRYTARVILFGGTAGDGTGPADTWSWDGSTWTQLSDMGPPPRTGAAMAHTGRGTILFGGAAPSSQTEAEPRTFGDTWVWQSGSWLQIQDMGPRARWGHTLAFAPTGQLTLFGGSSATVSAAEAFGDTWEHSGDPIDQGPPSLGEWTIFPENATLAQPGDQLKIEFSVHRAWTALTVGVQLMTPSAGMTSSLSGLAFPTIIALGAGATSGEVVITRGSEPLEPGTYKLGLLLVVGDMLLHERWVPFQVS